MATLILTSVGNAIGGPILGAVGTLVGSAIDSTIFPSKGREGPRLKELAVSTSSYGQSIPRVHGTMRSAGSVIWATELQESSETSGGKGQPKVTTYSYSASFAVALSSRPIQSVGRIWADGNLLRGAAGDLKAAGAIRVHKGHGDQPLDPLISAAEGGQCPAFRQCAYIVFEDLDLTDFGNRIPALSFEVVAEADDVRMVDMLAPASPSAQSAIELGGLTGFAIESGGLRDTLAAIEPVFPLACTSSATNLELFDPETPSVPILLSEAAAASGEDTFGHSKGARRDRIAARGPSAQALRYYDPERDYQPGIQRTAGPIQLTGQRVIDFPGVLSADRAKQLAGNSAQRQAWQKDRIFWRTAELDPSLRPGSSVSLPGTPGHWQIAGWEWRDQGVELELVRKRPAITQLGGSDAGYPVLPGDLPFGDIFLDYFEPPWDGRSSSNLRHLFAAVSATGASTGAVLQADDNGVLIPATSVARPRATMGVLSSDMPASPSLRLEPHSSLEVELSTPHARFTDASPEALARGANRTLIGEEIIQFGCASHIEGSRWRLSALLRGRGGTEAQAQDGHIAGTPVVLLDDAIVAVPEVGAVSGDDHQLVALALGSDDPVFAQLRGQGTSQRPLCPVHPRVEHKDDGSAEYCWIRRARGSWSSLDQVEVPLVEESEKYQVGVGPLNAPLRIWWVTSPNLSLDPISYADLLAIAPVQEAWVRQIGSFGISEPVLLEILP